MNKERDCPQMTLIYTDYFDCFPQINLLKKKLRKRLSTDDTDLHR